MRRIFAILLVAFVVFWMLYGLVPIVKANVNGFVANVAGPTVASVIFSVGASPFWKAYGGYVMLGTGFAVGIVALSLWHKADWRLRRWGAHRTARELGTTPTSDVPATPTYATTRPEEKLEVPAELAPKEEPTKEEATVT